MLSRASREHWTQRIEEAKALAQPTDRAITPACEAAAVTLRERAERHVERIAGITEKVLPHLEGMEPADLFGNARNLERFDFVARRNYGLENQPPAAGPLNLAILTSQAAVQVVQPNAPKT